MNYYRNIVLTSFLAIVFERISLKIGMILGGILLVIGGILIFLSLTFLEIEPFRVIQAIKALIVLPTSLAYASSIFQFYNRLTELLIYIYYSILFPLL